MQAAGLTIPSGQATSNAANLAQSEVIALVAPIGWTAGIPLIFLLSPDGTNFYPLSDWQSDRIFTIPIAPGTWMPIRTDTFPRDVWLKLQAGPPNAPVIQPTNQVFTLVTT